MNRISFKIVFALVFIFNFIAPKVGAEEVVYREMIPADFELDHFGVTSFVDVHTVKKTKNQEIVPLRLFSDISQTHVKLEVYPDKILEGNKVLIIEEYLNRNKSEVVEGILKIKDYPFITYYPGLKKLRLNVDKMENDVLYFSNSTMFLNRKAKGVALQNISFFYKYFAQESSFQNEVNKIFDGLVGLREFMVSLGGCVKNKDLNCITIKSDQISSLSEMYSERSNETHETNLEHIIRERFVIDDPNTCFQYVELLKKSVDIHAEAESNEAINSFFKDFELKTKKIFKTADPSKSNVWTSLKHVFEYDLQNVGILIEYASIDQEFPKIKIIAKADKAREASSDDRSLVKKNCILKRDVVLTIEYIPKKGWRIVNLVTSEWQDYGYDAS